MLRCVSDVSGKIRCNRIKFKAIRELLRFIDLVLSFELVFEVRTSRSGEGDTVANTPATRWRLTKVSIGKFLVETLLETLSFSLLLINIAKVKAFKV